MKLSFRSAICSLLVCITITSCSKDKNEISIIGKWNGQGIEYKEYYFGTTTYSSDPPDPGAYIEFKSDGTFFSGSFSFFSTGVWVQTGDKLFITSSGTTETWTVKKLTGNSLQLYWTDIDTSPTDYVEVTAFFNK